MDLIKQALQNIELRIHQHNNSTDESSYIFSRRPIELVFYKLFQDINQAINFEKKIKGWTRKKKEAIIQNNWDKLKELSICKNNSSHKYFNFRIEPPFDSAQGDRNI